VHLLVIGRTPAEADARVLGEPIQQVSIE